jgi:cytochrome b561
MVLFLLPAREFTPPCWIDMVALAITTLDGRLLELPVLTAPDQAVASNLKEIHKKIGYYFIGLHVAAALYQRCFLRDDALLRMLPRRLKG